MGKLASRVCLSAQFRDIISRNKSLTFRRRKIIIQPSSSP